MAMTETKLQKIFTKFPRKSIATWAKSQGLPVTTQKELHRHFFGVKLCNCGKETQWDNGLRNFREFCSYACMNASAEIVKRRNATVLQRYGVENAFQSKVLMKKARRTLKRRYGVTNPSKSAVITDRKRATMRKNFGTDHWTQNKQHFATHGQPFDEARLARAKNTCLERYGATNPFKAEQVKAKIKKTNLKKYGVENPGCLPRFDNYKVYEDRRGVKHVVVGYEHHALRHFDRKPTTVRLESRSAKLPKISYREGDKIRKYYPDFAVFQADTRILIEVKSDHTLTLDLDNLVRKCRAATRFMQKRGWDFHLILVNARQKRIRTCVNPTSLNDILEAFERYIPKRFEHRLPE